MDKHTIYTNSSAIENMQDSRLTSRPETQTSLETWCLSIVRALRQSQNETSEMEESLARTQTALKTVCARANKVLHKMSMANWHLQVRLHGITGDLIAMKEDRDEWFAKSQRWRADLNEALRVMNDMQQASLTTGSPTYAYVNLLAKKHDGQQESGSFGDVLLKQHLRMLTFARLEPETFPREAFRILSEASWQLSTKPGLGPIFVANTIISLTSHTLGFSLGTNECDWPNIRLEVQRHWCALDDLLSDSLHKAVQNTSAAAKAWIVGCGEDSCHACQANMEWLSLQARTATLRCYQDQICRICEQLQDEFEDMMSHQFFENTSRWVERALHNEYAGVLHTSPAVCSAINNRTNAMPQENGPQHRCWSGLSSLISKITAFLESLMARVPFTQFQTSL